jgi:CRISPR/Cas system-associated exonuclease Cas4 (RecB family)
MVTVARPSVFDQHDSTVNVTSLTVFADCPRKYYLQRYIGWNGGWNAAGWNSRFDPEELAGAEEEPEDLAGADLGSIVHELLAGKPGAYPEEARQLASVFQRSDLGKRAAGAARAEREWDFIVDVNGMLVRGSIDLWFERDGRIAIVDYKTDKNPHAELYAPQLALYGLAIERAFGKRPAETWLHFLRSNTAIAVPLDDAAISSVERLLAELAHAQETLEFDLREGEHCRTCQFYRSMCPSRFA